MVLRLILVLGMFQFCCRSTVLHFSNGRHIFELNWSELKLALKPTGVFTIREELNLIGDALYFSNIQKCGLHFCCHQYYALFFLKFRVVTQNQLAGCRVPLGLNIYTSNDVEFTICPLSKKNS